MMQRRKGSQAAQRRPDPADRPATAGQVKRLAVAVDRLGLAVLRIDLQRLDVALGALEAEIRRPRTVGDLVGGVWPE